MARPSKYDSHVKPRLSEVEDWVRNGASDKEIAERLHISADSLIEYKKKFSEFSECLKNTREYVDGQVENALLKRALGYSYEETIQEADGVGNKKAKKFVKHVIPDVTAQIFWLKNRRPDKWRDVKALDANITGENPYAGLSEKELRALAADGSTTKTDSG